MLNVVIISDEPIEKIFGQLKKAGVLPVTAPPPPLPEEERAPIGYRVPEPPDYTDPEPQPVTEEKAIQPPAKRGRPRKVTGPPPAPKTVKMAPALYPQNDKFLMGEPVGVKIGIEDTEALSISQAHGVGDWSLRRCSSCGKVKERSEYSLKESELICRQCWEKHN